MTKDNHEKTDNALYKISFNNDAPQGSVSVVSQINTSGPAFIFFPGNDLAYTHPAQIETLGNFDIQNLANVVRHCLESTNVSQDIIQQTLFYAIAYYTPSSFNEEDARTLLLKKHGRTNLPENITKGHDGFSKEEENPSYIEHLYSQIIAPRISRLNSKVKLDTQKACQNVAQLVFFAHCHGAYTILKLEELMKQKMQNIGYSHNEITQIQKHITAITYAPACPLGVSKMNIISFRTLGDDTLPGGNNLNNYMSILMDEDRAYRKDINIEKKATPENHPFNFKLSFYPGKLGNIFVIKEKYTYKPEKGYEGWNDHNKPFAEGDNADSKTLQQIMRRCIANAILHAHKQQKELLDPLSAKELAVGEASQNKENDTLIFEQACSAGKEQYAFSVAQIKKLLKEMDKQ